MSGSLWQAIDDFQSLGEFNRFVIWLEEQVSVGEAEEVTVEQPYVGAMSLKERWFRNSTESRIWRLVYPDPPFTGIFEPVA